MKVLIGGDKFVKPVDMKARLDKAVPGCEVTSIETNWPVTPFTTVGNVRETTGTEEEVIEAGQGAPIWFIHTQPVTAKVIDACPDLKMIAVSRGGPTNVDVEYATKKGILVTNAPGRNAVCTAEHSLGMILSAVRQLVPRSNELHEGKWSSEHYVYENTAPEVKGSNVAVIGYGRIGTRVARALQALDANVMVYDPYIPRDSVAPGMEYYDDLMEMLSKANIVTLHARENKDNYHMIGAEQLAVLPDKAIVVNCARQSLLDYDALCDALESGKLWGAGCDVMEPEPPIKGSRLLKAPNLDLTPHLAGASKQSAELCAQLCADDIARAVAGEKPVNIMNPEVWDSWSL